MPASLTRPIVLLSRKQPAITQVVGTPCLMMRGARRLNIGPSGSFHASAQPLEIKGIQLGISIDKLDKTAEGVDFKALSPARFKDCHYRQLWEGGTRSVGELTHLAGELTSTWTFSLIDDRLGQVLVHIPGDSFDPILRAMEVKYGKPRQETSIGRNFFNAPIESHYFIWQRKGEKLMAFVRNGPQRTGGLVLVADWYNKQKEAEEAARDRERAKGL
jgi:hypothetical protein